MFFYNRKKGHSSNGWLQLELQINSKLSNTCQIHFIHAIYGCKCSSKKYHIHWGMNSCSYFCEIKKHFTLKKLFPATKFSNLQGKSFFHEQLLWTTPFSYELLFHWDYLVNIYFFKVNSRNTRRRYEICPKFTINAIESCSGVFTVKCFCCWL